PAGNVRIGDFTTISNTNAMVAKPSDLENIPLRTGSGPTGYLRDVARVEDGADVVYNIALVNGRRTVYLPVTKRSDASTLDVVNALKAMLPKMRSLVPDDVHIDLAFDQSIYVKGAISGLITEGLLGAVLTGLMVLLFLRDWRSALIVVLTIPFSLLAAVVGLRLVGQTVNIMTLGGLALATGLPGPSRGPVCLVDCRSDTDASPRESCGCAGRSFSSTSRCAFPSSCSPAASEPSCSRELTRVSSSFG